MLCVKAPLPMEDIEKMAEACMKDIDDDDDANLEDDEDLLVNKIKMSSLDNGLFLFGIST